MKNKPNKYTFDGNGLAALMQDSLLLPSSNNPILWHKTAEKIAARIAVGLNEDTKQHPLIFKKAFVKDVLPFLQSKITTAKVASKVIGEEVFDVLNKDFFDMPPEMLIQFLTTPVQNTNIIETRGKEVIKHFVMEEINKDMKKHKILFNEFLQKCSEEILGTNIAFNKVTSLANKHEQSIKTGFSNYYFSNMRFLGRHLSFFITLAQKLNIGNLIVGKSSVIIKNFQYSAVAMKEICLILEMPRKDLYYTYMEKYMLNILEEYAINDALQKATPVVSEKTKGNNTIPSVIQETKSRYPESLLGFIHEVCKKLGGSNGNVKNDIISGYIKKCYKTNKPFSLYYIEQICDTKISSEVYTDILVEAENAGLSVLDGEEIDIAESLDRVASSKGYKKTTDSIQKELQTILTPVVQEEKTDIIFEGQDVNSLLTYAKQKGYTWEKHITRQIEDLSHQGSSISKTLINRFSLGLSGTIKWRTVKNNYNVLNIYGYRVVAYKKKILDLVDHDTYEQKRIPRFHANGR